MKTTKENEELLRLWERDYMKCRLSDIWRKATIKHMDEECVKNPDWNCIDYFITIRNAVYLIGLKQAKKAEIIK